MFSFDYNHRLRDQALLENLGPNDLDYECKHEPSPHPGPRYSHNNLDVYREVLDVFEWRFYPLENYGSEELLDIVPKGSQYGYDVIVYIGKAMLKRHRCNHEIAAELATRNIPISSGEIDYLAKKFIVYLAIAHSRNARKSKRQWN